MIEQLKAYLSNNECDYEQDSKQEILLDEDRIQIYFSVDEDFDVTITGFALFNKDGYPIILGYDDASKLINQISNLLNDWVKPIDNTVVIEGRSYN